MTIVAIALLVIILLIIGILFIPLTYEFKFSSRQPYMVDFSACWAFKKILFIHFGYIQGRPFIKEVSLLGKNKLLEIERDKNDVNDENIDTDRSVDIDKTELERKNISEETKTVSDSFGKIKPLEEVKPVDPIVISEDTQVVKNKKKTTKKESTETKSTNKSDTIDNKWWLPHVKQLSLYKAILTFINRCYQHSKPREFYIEGIFGTGDPCDTGMLAGLFYALCPKHMGAVEFNFIEPSYEGSGYLKGKIVPAILTWYGICLLCTKPIRNFIWAFLKFMKQKRKQNK